MYADMHFPLKYSGIAIKLERARTARKGKQRGKFDTCIKQTNALTTSIS